MLHQDVLLNFLISFYLAVYFAVWSYGEFAFVEGRFAYVGRIHRVLSSAANG